MNEANLIRKEFYELGKLEGQDRAKKDSSENGFRQGIQTGIEIGLYQGCLSTLKEFLEKWNSKVEDEKIAKIIKKINNCNYEDLEDMKTKIKIVKSNLSSLISKNKEK